MGAGGLKMDYFLVKVGEAWSNDLSSLKTVASLQQFVHHSVAR